jgi:hypothetical protein
MPFGSFANALPPAFFLLLHLVGFLVGAYFAFRAFPLNGTLGWAFTLYALAEAIYLTNNLDATVLLFAHALAEAFDLAAVILVFVGTIRAVRRPGPAVQLEASSSGGP